MMMMMMMMISPFQVNDKNGIVNDAFSNIENKKQEDRNEMNFSKISSEQSSNDIELRLKSSWHLEHVRKTQFNFRVKEFYYGRVPCTCRLRARVD